MCMRPNRDDFPVGLTPANLRPGDLMKLCLLLFRVVSTIPGDKARAGHRTAASTNLQKLAKSKQKPEECHRKQNTSQKSKQKSEESKTKPIRTKKSEEARQSKQKSKLSKSKQKSESPNKRCCTCACEFGFEIQTRVNGCKWKPKPHEGLNR